MSVKNNLTLLEQDEALNLNNRHRSKEIYSSTTETASLKQHFIQSKGGASC